MNNELKKFFCKKGCVKIRKDLIMSNPKLVKRMQCHMLIINTDLNFVEGTVTFWGDSEEFEPISQLERAPEYRAIFKDNDFVGFEKVDE